MIYGKPIWEWDIEYPDKDTIIVKEFFVDHRTYKEDLIKHQEVKGFALPFAANKGFERYEAFANVHLERDHLSGYIFTLTIKRVTKKDTPKNAFEWLGYYRANSK